MEYKDYYATLGVPKDVSPTDLQRAYRKLARQYHPDVNKDAAAENKFKEINEAYEVLKDAEKRAKYDRFGSAWKQTQQTGAPPPGFEDIFSIFTGQREPPGGFNFGGEGFSSFFEMLFGGGGPGAERGARAWGGWGPSQGEWSQGGSDHDARLSLSLEEAARGGKREITLVDPTTGAQRTLRVKIPRGVRPGQRIRLSGQGGHGVGKGKRGDLYLTVEINPHPRFKLEGRDLHTVLPITPWEGVLGARVPVPTLDGEVEVKIPAGSSSGRKIRLRGRGFPDAKSGRGDLYAELKIIVPEEISTRERELFEELAKTSGFRART